MKTHTLFTCPPKSRNPLLKLFAASFLLAAFSHSAQAYTLPVYQDTSSSSNLATAKLAGKAATLPVSAKRDALMQFQVSDLNISSTNVQRALLTIYLTSVTKPGIISLRTVTQSWSEIVTNGAVLVPTSSSVPIDSFPVTAASAHNFIIIDVTPTVKAWLDTPATDFGFSLTTTGLTSVAFGAKEGPAVGYPAMLEVDTDTATVGSSFPDITDINGSIGIGTPNPTTQFANTSGNILGTDGYGLSTTSLGWNNSAGFGYTAGFHNPGTGVSSDGVTIGIAGTAGRILDLNANSSSVMVVNGNGKVGIGTSSPGDLLSIRGGALSFHNNGNNVPYVGMDYDNTGDSLRLRGNIGGAALQTDYLTIKRTSGNVGIGTTNPAAKLQVNGNIQLGANGTAFAASGPENLRIIRGIVNSAGTTVGGSGFTSSKNGGTGSYTISFTTAFSSPPTVCVTGVQGPALAGGILTASSVTIQTLTPGGAAANGDFHFIAIGPQ